MKSKCRFLAPSVIHLGHMIDPLKEKFQDVPSPKNVSELKSYLGLLKYYSKFLPNMAEVLAPLYKLLRIITKCSKTLAICMNNSASQAFMLILFVCFFS